MKNLLHKTPMDFQGCNIVTLKLLELPDRCKNCEILGLEPGDFTFRFFCPHFLVGKCWEEPGK